MKTSGGYVRFFHNELNRVIKCKYLSGGFGDEIHDIMFDFHMGKIRYQLHSSAHTLTNKPVNALAETRKSSASTTPTTAKTSTPPVSIPAAPSYYSDCLQQVVHHQIYTNKVDDFKQTLRNIYFVRERIVNQQGRRLQEEYLIAVKHTRYVNESGNQSRNIKIYIYIYIVSRVSKDTSKILFKKGGRRRVQVKRKRGM